MTKIWLAFLAITFLTSILALTLVQLRALRASGSWGAFRERPFRDLYWRDLSPLLRALLWPGFIAFGITLAWFTAVSVAR